MQPLTTCMIRINVEGTMKDLGTPEPNWDKSHSSLKQEWDSPQEVERGHIP